MKTLKIPTFGLLAILALLVFSLFTTPAKAEFFASGGVYTTTPTIDKCTGACNFKVKDLSGTIVSAGYYFKNRILDVGIEAATTGQDYSQYLLNVRKRIGKWSIEAGTGRYSQEADITFNSTVPPTHFNPNTGVGFGNTENIDSSNGTIYHIGASYKFDKRNTLIARYMHGSADLSVTRNFFKVHHGITTAIKSETSKAEIDNSTVWVGYRFGF